jgi:hypothetical protein
MLRVVVVSVCVLLALTAAGQVALGRPYGWLPVGIEAAIFALLIAFERGRYRPRLTVNGPWTPTGERFADPTSGEVIDVYANPGTGERDYRPSP